MASLVYRIPCCGGFCAPTVSPEESCLKHVSNEYTLPAGPIFVKAPTVLESNVVCRTCGCLGLSAANDLRKPLMLSAAAVNVLGCILSIFALVGLGSTYSALVFGRWVSGELNVGYDEPLTMYLGVSSRVLAIDCEDNAECHTVFQALDFIDEGDNVYSMEQDDDESCSNAFESDAIVEICEDCKDNQYSASTLILGVITYWPTILTNLQRSTEFGDVNCQKVMGIVSNVIGTLTSIMALTGYAEACYSALPSSIDILGGTINIAWSLGFCFGCLIAATFLRVIDLLVHVIVPTPPSRHEPMASGVKDISEYLDSKDGVVKDNLDEA